MAPASVVRLCLMMVSGSLALLIAGCVRVREDRTIEFSRDGGQVAFQHGNDGVYVADRDGAGLTKVFQPDETVLATSRPLASPTDGRIIFATAQPLGENAQPQPAEVGPLPADGRIIDVGPVLLTCWLRDEPHLDQPGQVRKLFSATCGHVGYVAAGLAVRWHPGGNRILYVADLGDGSSRHSIFEHDLASQQSRRVFPLAADAILCDWTPLGSHLVCVLGNHADRDPSHAAAAAQSGTWIGTPGDDASWWRVPRSEQLSQAELPSSLIEMLRASRPAWTGDETQFAFVSRQSVPAAGGKDAKETHRLHRVEFASRSIQTVAEADGPFIDLHWSPDGRRLGFVSHSADAPARIGILDESGTVVTLPVDQPIRNFAGFDATGARLAYVVASAIDPPPESPWWALLLIPDPLARDSVWVADSITADPGKEVFSGMRVTFPLWSPSEERLSLWLTFTPRYRSLLSIFHGWGLWPGDPAATLDVPTGAISWLAVTPQEELQIGHYHLLKRNDAEAWRWYERARQKLPVPQPPKDWQEFTQRIGAPENSRLFEFLCLKRLGREEEAAARWTECEQHFFPPKTAGTQNAQQQGHPPQDAIDTMLAAFGPQAELLKCLIHDLYVAEVFLSVDALDDALTHFRADQPHPASESATLSRALVTAQLLLIARDREGYLTHCTDSVAPLALRMSSPPAGQPAASAQSNFVLETATGLCLAPLFRTDFVNRLPEPAVRRSIPAWKKYRDNLSDGLPAVAVDLFLRAAALKLHDKPATQSAEDRLARNPAARQVLSGKSIDEALAGWFEMSKLATQW